MEFGGRAALVVSVTPNQIVCVTPGTGFNPLLDVVVLTALAVGDLAGRATTSVDPPEAPVLLLAVLVSVVWAGGLDLVRTVGFDVRGAVAAARSGRPPARAAIPAARIVKPGDEVLTEDPSIDIALGRQPVVMDPFMVMRLDRVRPELVEPLIAWIQSADSSWSSSSYRSRISASTTGGTTFTTARV